MRISDRDFLGQVKKFLKRVPAVQWLLELKSDLINKKIRIRELTNLKKQNRIIVFPTYSKTDTNTELTRDMVHEVVKEWLDLYGIIHLRRTTSAFINPSAGNILLYIPQALLSIPASHEEYLEGVRSETKRVIRLAEEQEYKFQEFVWNDHLDEIFDINTSKEVRQGEPMRGWYREKVQPRNHSKEELQYRKYYGAFKDGKLYAYFHFWVCGDFAIGKHIIGHAQHLKYGIMNGLISWTIKKCVEDSKIRWLYYGTWQTGSLGAFKKHAGFQEYAIILDLKDDQELLKYSKRKVKSLWRI